MAKMLANLPVEKLSVVVNQLTLPVMAGLQTDQGRMRRSFLRTLRLVAFLTLPSCLAMALLADDLVYFALGVKWLPAVPVLRALCFFGLLRSVDVLIPPVLLARYRAAFLFWWTMGLLLLMPFVFWAGATVMGSLGVALGWVVVYPVVRLWVAREGLRELQISWSTIVGELWPVTAATLMMVCVVLAVRWAVPGGELVDRVVRMVSAAVLGTAAYGAGISWWGRPIVTEIAEVTGWVLRPTRIADGGQYRVAPAPHSDIAGVQS
jgi:O-antigen/teichoic acid export membrane protein